ncbi:winged helix-turn-helix domain-containing protein (plasmid) [Clavibacter michiganensis subsp. michiganensis]|uniref:winged helix-turn-helix domain-containing protein n=1 Tax=Clavibacter michiganensis TaxID=28447 RepID=UPI001302EE6B|nr:crosslink repair DNA glycosylase YcaQ family protein [Clavibacter michiganensis]KAF0258286.1 hypothetical protein DOU02_09075 [Clavibacter michiganensis subsp. michiganensis]MBW8028081.1 winged helix-turn-helix domain-containing protein [Clavibacter michiganensis subsp. michiganensis]MDO4076131.1 crosslink repair DNA glycosylase YcaQ family protein [Clavibacter michiganensis]MDO4130992.1 crosslink repair DNA glycosylase YcaQ family protein [Clavibacter michiganensis]MWJ16776.1 winged helix-
MADTVSPSLARRVALGAQGLGRPHPGAAGTRRLAAEIRRLGLLQIDSVNVFERSHHLPMLARVGPYDRAALDRMLFGGGDAYTEYWAHQAAVLPVDDLPLFAWRMEAERARRMRPGSWASEHLPLIAEVRAELARTGPVPASAIEHESNVRTGPWWGWSDVKRALEAMFAWGEIASAGRRGFERVYGLAEDVLPADVLAREVPEEDAVRELVRRAAVAHGIGTAADLGDYHRLSRAATDRALRDLADAGEVLPVAVPGWEGRGKPLPVWLHRDARLPRRIRGEALLSPFDPVVWFRERALRLFDLHYRIEIYTPAAQRVHGYYVLPVLVDDEIVARVDLKSDRQAGVLRVQASWIEGRHDPAAVAERIAPLLERAAAWQGLERVGVVDRGTLAPALRAHLPAIAAGALDAAVDPAG